MRADKFMGWPEQAFDILLKLDGEPTSKTREKLRKGRELYVRQPMISLLQDIADADPAWADFSVWGFAKDLWWWQHQGAIVRIARKVEILLRFSLDGLSCVGAWIYPPAQQIALFRQAVANEASGSELAAIVSTLEEQGYTITGDRLSRMPRGFPVEHERSRLLRHRSLRAERAVGSDDRLTAPNAVDQVLTAFGELAPMLYWFAKNVAEPEPFDRV